MGTTEQELAEFEQWLQADSDEERERIRSGWAIAREEEQPTPVLTIPASAESALRAIVGTGIEPRQAVAMLAEAGHRYERTGKRTAGLKRRAGVVSTGRGRGSRWRLVQN